MQSGELLERTVPALGYELVDWGGVTHCPGGSHGALRADDSLAPLVLCGLEPGTEATREQWALCDVADLVLDHFGIGERRDSLRVHQPAGLRSQRVRGGDRSRHLGVTQQ